MNPMQSPNVGPGGKDFGGKEKEIVDPYDLAWHRPTTKRSFEQKLAHDLSYRVSKQKMVENIMINGQPRVVVTTCYYYKDSSLHIGSWSKGHGWIYNHAYDEDK